MEMMEALRQGKVSPSLRHNGVPLNQEITEFHPRVFDSD